MKLTMSLAAAVRRSESRPEVTAGKLIPTMSDAMVITTSISISVTPEVGLRVGVSVGQEGRQECLPHGELLLAFPTDDVCIQPFSAWLAVAAPGH